MKMHSLRKALCWLFALSSLVCAWMALFDLVRATQASSEAAFRGSIMVFALFAPLALLFGMTWWASWRGLQSARRWALVASVVNVAIAILPFFVFYTDSFASPFLAQAGIGIAGLIAFWRPYQQTALANESAQMTSTGDGTNAVLNKFSDFLPIVSILLAFPLWGWWSYEKNIPESHVPIVLMFLIVGLLITLTHELGHAIVGFLLGMKLMALHIGPFQWRIVEGRWHFEFSLAGLLVQDGATSVVPTTSNFSHREKIWVCLGGPLINLVSGVSALWIVSAMPAESPLQAGGGMGFFGACSLCTGLLNLIPFRTRTGYSDGAQIRQLIARGPWAELHRAVAIVHSSLVTPLRPRDFDIDGLRKAANGITSGVYALSLRLYEFVYYLDCDDMQASGVALREAEAVVVGSAGADISRRLGSEFVFGNAYVLRDAVAARDWWNKFEAEKPRINADYWKAACALHWIEGDLSPANDAWTKGDELAQKMPRAGVYEFDRHCFHLLRKALDEKTATSTSA
jgi:hypothetical protein